jgi:hypothetical protein
MNQCALRHPPEGASAPDDPKTVECAIMTITGHQLCDAYLSAPMLHYFQKKFSHLTDSELRARVEETLKFLAISTYCTGAIPVSRDIDEIWHYWILQTQEYEALCSSLPRGTFIHHTSNDYIECFDRDIGKHDNLPLDVKMLATYVANYGPFEERRVKYWLLAAYLVEKRGWNILQLNDWLTSGSRASSAAGSDVPIGSAGRLDHDPPPASIS